MYALGRLLQFAGLTILPFAMLLEFQHRVTLGQYLVFTTFGVTLFAIGYMLMGLSKKDRP